MTARHYCLTLVLLLALPARQVVDVTWEPATPVNGSPCLFRVRLPKPLKSLNGRWQGRQVFFNFDASSGDWFGLAGIDLDTAAGEYQLTLNLTYKDGARLSLGYPVPVGLETYMHTSLSASRKFLNPRGPTLVRIKREQRLKRETFRRTSKDRLWQGNFIAPLDDVVTESFGTERTFNGELQSVHQGLDFRAATGTPVRAMNAGKVILAHEMFYEGGFLVIDHGQGLLTTYLHLSRS